jgi:RNA polymerase sigma-70 factor (ECF subfamily)
LTTEHSDEYILALIRNPETKDKGFTLLMDKYKERIYWHIRRLVVSHEDAEDILQETFISVYRFAGSFNGKSRIYTWIYRIATNECLEMFRKGNNTGHKMEELTDKIAGKISGCDHESGDEILLKFQKAILQLPGKQRIVFNLRYYDDLSYEEIGLILKTSVNALKTSYHYAQEKIKNYMINS